MWKWHQPSSGLVRLRLDRDLNFGLLDEYDNRLWDSLRGRLSIIDAYIELSSVIWQASNHISTRVCQVGMFPGRKAGCSKDTLVEAVGN